MQTLLKGKKGFKCLNSTPSYVALIGEHMSDIRVLTHEASDTALLGPNENGEYAPFALSIRRDEGGLNADMVAGFKGDYYLTSSPAEIAEDFAPLSEFTDETDKLLQLGEQDGKG